MASLGFRIGCRRIPRRLYLARHRCDWIGRLTPGQRYSRKDVSRIADWDSNQQGTMFGYEVDLPTCTCPVFITYPKGSDVLESIAHGDEFRDPHTIRWFIRSRRTLEHNEVCRILAGDVAPAIGVFVKKDGGEGTDFFYLGGATPADPQQRSMPAADGEPLLVVTMDLALERPVSPEIWNYLTSRV